MIPTCGGAIHGDDTLGVPGNLPRVEGPNPHGYLDSGHLDGGRE